MFIEQLLPTARGRLATIPYDAPLTEAAKLLSQPKYNLIVVLNADGTVAGVISSSDIVRQISICQGRSCMTQVSAVMTRDVATCTIEDLLDNIWSMMRLRGLKNVPVIDSESRPLGMLYARDALQMLLGEAEHQELLLRDYVMGIGYR